MAANFVTITDGHKTLRPLTKAEDMAQRDSSANRRHHAAAMAGDHDGKRRQTQRNYNLYITEQTPLKGYARVASTLGADFDLPPADKTPEQLAAEVAKLCETILEKKEEIGLLMLERTRKGCHIVCRRAPEQSQVQNLDRISGVVGYPYDPNAKDLQRVYFSPPSSEILYLDDSIYAQEEYPMVSEPAAKPPKKAKPEKLEKLEKPDKREPERLSEQQQPLYKSLSFTWPEISQKWWQQYNGGLLPQEGERNTLYFEFLTAMSWFTSNPENLRQACHGCTLADDELDALINNVTANYRPAAMPSKLCAVMDALLRESSRTYTLSRRTLPQSIRHCLSALPARMDMPLVAALAPMIGALATGVRLRYLARVNGINLSSFIAGESGSNKGALTDIIMCWSQPLRQQDAPLLAAEEEWRQAKQKVSSSAKEQPAKPQGVIRCPTVNSTLPQLCRRLGSTGGKHAFSFSEEADEFTSRMSGCMTDISTMQRKAYDGAAYERETVGAEGVNVHINALLWNTVFAGTPDSLHRMVPNVTDGSCSRLCVASTPDNTFAHIEVVKPLNEAQRAHIQQVARLLTLMGGTVELPALEKTAMEWTENLRAEAEAQQDKVLARARMRTHVSAMRMTLSIMLVRAAEQLMSQIGYDAAEALLQQHPDAWIPLVLQQQKTAKGMFETIADSLVNESMRYFRGRITAAYAAKNYAAAPCGRRATGGNEAIYAALPSTFSLDDVFQLMIKEKPDTKRNTASCQLKRWKQAGRCIKTKTGYAKC